MLLNEYTTSVELKRAEMVNLDDIGKSAPECHFAEQYLFFKLQVSMATGYLLPQLDKLQPVSGRRRKVL